MEELLLIVDKLSKCETEDIKLTNDFYKKIAEYKFSDRNESGYLFDYLLPKVHELYNKQFVRKDILYLSLLSCNNTEVLQKCLKYENTVLKLDIGNPTSLYNYCIIKKQHWFKKVITTYNETVTVADRDLHNKILALKLIYLTNSANIKLEHVKKLLEEINRADFDDFWKHYLILTNHFIDTVEFCKLKKCSNDAGEIFYYTSNHCLLDTFSNYLDLSHLDWEEILSRIYQEENIHENENISQSKNFIAFTILAKLFICILSDEPNSDINCLVQDIKMKLLNLQDKLVQIELLFNIFATIFLKTNHLLDQKLEEGYKCKEKEIRLILFLLKEIIDELKFKNVYDKCSPEYSNFLSLNKHVTDAMWRMELIINVKDPRKCIKNMLKYMLAPPESLIHMCLKQGDFERAYQVIEISTLKDQTLPLEIEYCEKLQILKATVKKALRIKEIQKVNPKISLLNIELAVDKTIEQFFKNNPVVLNPEREDLLTQLCKEHDFFDHFRIENELFMNMLDLAITQPRNYEDCAIMLQLAFENNTLNNNVTSSYSKYCKKLLDLCNEVGRSKNIAASELLTSPSYYLDLNKYTKEQEFLKNISAIYDEVNNNLEINEDGILNGNHPSHRSIIKLNKACVEYVESTLGYAENVKYLSKLFNYLKAFSRVLYIEQNSSDIVSKGKHTSYFDLLYHNRSELMGKLLFERNLDPSEFEKYFGKLKLDYLYHVIGNCFPTINLHTRENVTEEELYPENSLYVPSKSIISYIQKRNWLLAFVLNEMHKVEDVKIDISEIRVRSFLNYLKLPKIEHLRVLYDNNDIITALQNEISAQKVSDYVNSQIIKHESLIASHYSHISIESVETGEELVEDGLKSTNWTTLYDILDSIPENQLRKDSSFVNLADMVLVNLIQDGFEIEYLKYLPFVSNRNLRISTILCHMRKWSGTFCMDVIKSEITKFGEEQDGKIIELKIWLLQIELCEKLKGVLDVPTWSDAYEMCENQKENVILKLLEYSKINLLLDFIDLHRPSEELLLNVNEYYLSTVFEALESFEPVKLLLDTLPLQHSVTVCYELLKILKKLEQLKFIVQYLLSNVNDDSLRNAEISLKMLSVFSHSEQDQLLCLIYEPINIIEILIMNTKLDSLAAVLSILQSEISHTEFNEDKLSVEKIDEVLRNYAEKSLDFRVITQPNPRLLRTPECKLMQSIDSLNFGSDHRFVMPEEVPTKDEWVPNNEVLECMCCQKTTFSMFNRRHHCRRCGRVVCYNCSLHRMLVPSYGDILVRVCINCYHQTEGESSTSDTVSTKSIVNDYWLLTENPEHNKIVREEFSYEHAPSVSLCLSLMKYHSRTTEYPKFLLEQCNLMLKLLQPNQEPLQEIDYLLVIKMLKSLAIAAKMSSMDCNMQYGTSMADRILSQADLLSLLAERGCLNLLPICSSYAHGSYIDASILRRLRDRLLEREQWNLALEVSTKAGLENTGVFAAWGKSCLKAGYLLLAREKFQRCLDKSGYYETTSELSLLSDSSEYLNRTRTISKVSSMSTLSETKPTKNPPLLNEIVYILESNTRSIDNDLIREIEKQKMFGSSLTLNQSFSASTQADASVCISNKLKNLKNISAGVYYQASEQSKVTSYSTRPPIDGFFYDECVYYLTRYGSHLSLLEFYVKHGDIDRSLNYIIENQLGADVFIDVYMRCLKDGIVGILQENMSRIDSTLDVWKDYLRNICRHLEKQNMLHSLYQLQQFMGDYIRAAMTCIRFYQENVTNFTELSGNVQFLHKTEEHLKQVMEQEQWVEVATVRKLSSASKESFEEKGIINPSLVMKICPKDINKHISTVWLQNELTAFLADRESSGVKPVEILTEILPVAESVSKSNEEKPNIPTLFGTTMDKIHLAVLSIICGSNVEDGFGFALRIIQLFSLKPVKIYCEAGKQLAKMERYSGIAQLVSCIKQTGVHDSIIMDMCDEMLTLAVATFTKANVTGTKVEDLIKQISDRATKISAYIEAKQLKTAYFLAVKYKRMSDIRRILREAELLNQPSIKALCQKVLQSHAHTPTHSNE